MFPDLSFPLDLLPLAALRRGRKNRGLISEVQTEGVVSANGLLWGSTTFSEDHLEDVHFVYSKRGSMLLCYQGYTYHMKQEKDLKRVWRCSQHCSYQCRATVTTVMDQVCKMNNGHNHPPSADPRIRPDRSGD